MSAVEAINIILIVFVFLTAIAATRVRELVSAVFLLGAYSFFLAVLWAVLASVDVAFTEAMVGVGASTIFLILGLFRSQHFVKRSTSRRNIWPCLMIGALAFLFVWGSLDLHLFGDVTSEPSLYLSPFYLQNAYHHMLTPNTVTAVVVDYRGFDTLIETAVIFTAGIACLLIMREKV